MRHRGPVELGSSGSARIWGRILHLIRSATRPFCSLFVQHSICALAPPMRASIRPRSSACAARLPFHREWLGPIASAAAEINALSGRNFCNLIVQQMRGSLAERFKCKVYDLTAKLFLHLIVQPEEHLPGPLNDLNANDN